MKMANFFHYFSHNFLPDLLQNLLYICVFFAIMGSFITISIAFQKEVPAHHKAALGIGLILLYMLTSLLWGADISTLYPLLAIFSLSLLILIYWFIKALIKHKKENGRK